MSNQVRVDKARQLLAEGRIYPRGCSEFVCDVLGVPWEDANSLLGDAPTHAGSNGAYTLSAGDIAGWAGSGQSGHVAIFVGGDRPFIDVRNPGATPRYVSSYGTQAVSKSSKY